MVHCSNELALDRDLAADLDHAFRRQPEEIADVSGIALHRRVHRLDPLRQRLPVFPVHHGLVPHVVSDVGEADTVFGPF